MNLRETARPLRRGLGRLRRRVRALVLLLGVSRVLAFLVAALLLFFLADYFLRLPMSVRRILFFGVAAGLAVVASRRLLRPLATPLEEMLLASRVEDAHPDLRDRLSSSLAFSGAIEDPENEDSPELMRHVVEETAGLAGSIRFEEVARARIPLRWAAGTAALLLVTASAALARPQLAGTFLERDIYLRDVSWPRRTTLQVVDIEPGEPRAVTRGRETVIEIRAEGSVPDRVLLSYWESGKPRRVESAELAPSAEDPALFAFNLYVHTSYEFTVTGGDDERALVYGIAALTPPAIVGIRMDCTFPAYLEREPATLEGGDQRVPERTKIRLEVKVNEVPLRRVTIMLGGEEPRAMEPAGPRLYATALTATKDLRYSLRLAGKGGESNDPAADTYVLRVARDRAPQLRIQAPGPRAARLARGVVLISFKVRDDHRIDAVKLRYRIGETGKERVVAVGEAGGEAVRLLTSSPQSSAGSLLGLAAIDLARLRTDKGEPVRENDVLFYGFEATDSAGHVQGTKRAHQVAIQSEDDLSQEIDNRQAMLHGAVSKGSERAATARANLQTLAEHAGDAVDFRRYHARTRASQARLIDDLDAIARNLATMLNRYVFNRLHDESAVDQMLPFYERHLLDRELQTGRPFSGTLYRALWTAAQERAIRSGGPLAKLMEMADLSDRLAGDEGPGAYAALGVIRKRRATPEQISAGIAAAQRGHERIEKRLRRLQRLMREWQNFEGVLRFFKDLRGVEKGLIEKLKGLK